MGSIDRSKSPETRTQNVFLFALNRTCSHVLCRLLSGQPGWVQSNYHFKPAFDFARESFNWGPLYSVSNEQREGVENLLQGGFDEIQTELESAKTKVSPIDLYWSVLTTVEFVHVSERTYLLHLGAFQAVTAHVGWSSQSSLHCEPREIF